LKKEFGPGAEGAAKTFQGAINRMQNSTKLLYEAFEPAAVGFLNSVVVPLTGGLKTITEGVRAYFQGQKAATPEAENFNNVLKTLVPSLSGIAQNVGFALQQLLPLGQVLGAVILQITRFLALPLVGYLASTYLQVVLLTSGFKLLATSGVGLALVSIARFVAQGAIAASVMLKLQVATQQTTVATYLFGQAIQTVMIKSVVGVALVAISTLISKIMELRGQLSAIGNDAKGMEDLAKTSARMGDVSGTKEAIGNIKNRLATFKELQRQLKDVKQTSSGSMFDDRAAISESYEISTDLARKLVELGVISAKALTKTSGGYSVLADNMDTVNALVNKNVDQFTKAGQKGNILVDQAIRKNKELKAQVEPPGGEEEDDQKKVSLESYYSLQDQLAKAQTQADIDRLEAAFEHARAMVNAEYDLKEAKANSFQKKAIAFQKEIFAITSEQDAALFQNRNKVLAAAGSVAGGAGGGAGGTGAIFGATGRTFNAPGWVHGHFQNQNREALVKDTVEVVMGLLSKGVSPELGSGARFTSGMNAKQVEALVRQGIGSHKQYASGVGAVDVFMPKGTQVPVPVSGIQDLGGAAGVTGSLPRGSQLMHLDPASRMGVAPGKVTGDVKRDKLAEQQVILTAREANAANIEKEAEAIAELKIATANYVQSLLPTAEQALQNQLLQQRITLTQNSFSPEILEAQLAFAEQELQVAESMKIHTEEINRKTAAGGKDEKRINA